MTTQNQQKSNAKNKYKQIEGTVLLKHLHKTSTLEYTNRLKVWIES